MNRLKRALSTTGLSFAAYAWDPPPSGDYGVYGLDTTFVFQADSHTSETVFQGTVDYFTRSDGLQARKKIETALAGLQYKLNSIQYENDTKYLHLEWLVNLYGEDNE